MSSKNIHINAIEIKKTFISGTSARSSQRNKADFKLRRFTGAKSEFGVSAMCAGTVFGLSGLKD